MLNGAIQLVKPGEGGWDAARAAWNLAIDQRPAMVARPGGADEVAAVVKFARENGLRVAVQAEGHGAGALAGVGEDTLLLKTGRMIGAEVDAENRRARVGAAAKWRDVGALASPLGLAGLSGSSGEVGVVGEYVQSSTFGESQAYVEVAPSQMGKAAANDNKMVEQRANDVTAEMHLGPCSGGQPGTRSRRGDGHEDVRRRARLDHSPGEVDPGRLMPSEALESMDVPRRT